jgi:hypothetical protein
VCAPRAGAAVATALGSEDTEKYTMYVQCVERFQDTEDTKDTGKDTILLVPLSPPR